ncbi:MAG: Uma2 family endonuclease [Bryobacteraceae bacterium]
MHAFRRRVYLRLERAAEYKSEYVGGEIFAMAGGSPRHSELAANWIFEVKSKLRGSNCRLFTSGLRVRTPATGSYVYPDVAVVCGELRVYETANDVLTNPAVVVEVLSLSTAHYDRGKKFELYRAFPSPAGCKLDLP